MALPASTQQLDELVKGNQTNQHDVAAVASSFTNQHDGAASPPPYTPHPTSIHHDRLASLKTSRAPFQTAAYPPDPTSRPFHPDPSSRPFPTPDPTSLLPSSPPQIYLNLLILEASLRSQYLTLRARRRQNTFVLTLLSIWIATFFYILWLRPREDGKGIGGSRYWVVDMFQKMAFITGLVTALLFWATGQWERGVRWPRRWIGIANRGLRGMNAKIVVIRGSWSQEIAAWVRFVMPFSGGLWGGETGGSSYHFVNVSVEKKGHLADGLPRHRIVEDGKEYAEEDVAPGGDLIKMILLPKPFTPDFREGWEIYRAEYWGRENERRAELRRRIRARKREVARAQGGWLWWTGWRGWKRAKGGTTRNSHVESHSHTHAHHHPPHLSSSNSFGKERKRRPSTLRGREASSHSRSSSRSTTPTPDIDDHRLSSHSHSRERRWSNSTTGSTASSLGPSTRQKKPSINLGGSAVASTARQPSSRLSSYSERPVTPNRGSSGLSMEGVSARDYEADASGFEESNVGSLGMPSRPSTIRRGSRERGRGEGEERVFPNAPSA